MKKALIVTSMFCAFSAFAQNETKPVDCSKDMKKLTTAANRCMNIKKAEQRKPCFDKVGQTVEKSKMAEQCKEEAMKMRGMYDQKERSKYPNQPSSFTDGPQGPQAGQPGQPGQPNMGQPGQPNMGQPGQPNMGQSGQPNMGQPNQQMMPADPKACEQAVKMIRPKAEKCLKVKVQAKRAACWEALGKEIEKKSPKGCDAILNPLKEEFQAKEKEMYPDQEPALK